MEYVTASPDHPRSEPASVRAGRRSLALALLSGALGAAVVLLASRQRWSQGTISVAGGDFPLTAQGSDVTGVPAALAVVGLAALVAVFAVRRSGRVLVSALLALSGAGTIAAALLGAQDGAALDDKAAEASGDTAATVDALGHTGWPYVAAVGGALILLAGLLALRHGRRWPAMSGRYERDGTPRPRRARPVDPDRPEDMWKALDRGEDPTGPGPA
ncbi:TIGR02234 family membrane protein [Streptomyces scabiei]|uniref:TIGR02234 family membrane protein n=1 Tax=Streptomyces scabiei TaxID=1930 RepID=UPI001B303FA0|nr:MULTISPECIES: TIGR02234 family membrane protein [Streptomyces]MBP5864297.1 TIGR02234 family membrane protein [Streptomyces sp. LBUM 1484]MBP5882827.1 TIGR02234 family membrane protein [Streptomyces sp. LBUM 1487]MBP5894304.1 TIGR02234 family membrane protein [Streptomyces sp. LBUM 1481]MBP5898896.1 TIGR02234 family membrane protein [Streptomyces sp. LBUM 1488]MBP5924565.1 TIGR02234 family membrane protein [Streptomyces sp. LBUM 1483]